MKALQVYYAQLRGKLMFFYPMPLMFQRAQIWQFIRGLIISWTIWPIMMMAAFTFYGSYLSGNGHPVIFLTQTVIETGWKYQPTGQPGVYLVEVCPPPPAPIVLSGPPLPPVLPFAAPLLSACHPEKITLSKLAVRAAQNFMVPYVVLGIIGSVLVVGLYLSDLVENLQYRSRWRKRNPSTEVVT